MQAAVVQSLSVVWCTPYYISTTEMVADGMTKPLQRVAFERFKAQLGVVN
jgi:hypothetical protein